MGAKPAGKPASQPTGTPASQHSQARPAQPSPGMSGGLAQRLPLSGRGMCGHYRLWHCTQRCPQAWFSEILLQQINSQIFKFSRKFATPSPTKCTHKNTKVVQIRFQMTLRSHRQGDDKRDLSPS